MYSKKYLILYNIIMNSKILGRNIQRERLRLGLSQEAFASMLGVTGSYIGKIESGTIELSLSKIQEISAVLKVDINNLTKF